MRKLIVLFAFLFFVGIVGAFTLVIEPSLGINHNVPEGVNKSGAPVVGVIYFLTDDGVTREMSLATVYSVATENGFIDLNYSTTGDCVWSGTNERTTEVKTLEELHSGNYSINDTDKIYWSYVANTLAIVNCSATIDLNVVS